MMAILLWCVYEHFVVLSSHEGRWGVPNKPLNGLISGILPPVTLTLHDQWTLLTCISSSDDNRVSLASGSCEVSPSTFFSSTSNGPSCTIFPTPYPATFPRHWFPKCWCDHQRQKSFGSETLANEMAIVGQLLRAKKSQVCCLKHPCERPLRCGISFFFPQAV